MATESDYTAVIEQLITYLKTNTDYCAQLDISDKIVTLLTRNRSTSDPALYPKALLSLLRILHDPSRPHIINLLNEEIMGDTNNIIRPLIVKECLDISETVSVNDGNFIQFVVWVSGMR